jgi:hypothetical protein
LCVLISVLTCAVSGAHAHNLNIARFAFFEQSSPDEIRLVVDNLPENLRPDALIDWPPGCEVISRQETAFVRSPSVEVAARCSVEPGAMIATRWGQDGGLLEWHYADGRVQSSLLSGGRRGAALQLPQWTQAKLPVTSFLDTAALHIRIGAEHVLSGWDHLAFVLCLAMLASGVSLVWLISAFTVGHSLSLGLAHAGVVNIPIAPVEAIIALSVAFMAREAWLQWRSAGETQPSASGKELRAERVLLVAGFGLIHGLGFASAFGGIGVDAARTVAALLFFNIGVELGQIAFVAAVAALLFVARPVSLERGLVAASLSIVGGLGIFWTLERVAGM